MSEISYHELEPFLAKAAARSSPTMPTVSLLFGEEMLYKKAQKKLLDAILGDLPRDLHCEVVDGLNENVATALEHIKTYSLLSHPKIVAFTEARLFHSRQNLDRLWEQAAQANQPKKAARFFLDFLSVRHLSLDDLGAASMAAVLKPPGTSVNLDWVPALIDYCRQQGLRVPAALDPQQDLQQAIETGFPAGHHLIVTTSLVDKRRTLYKTMREVGLVVDCSVPKGDRKADRAAQEAVMDATLREGLLPYGKRMDPAARRVLYDLIGFDLRTLASSVEKLVHFTGERETIGVADVRQNLVRTRQDPLYALTEAVANRQLSTALSTLDSLLTGGEFDHPLPLLAAVTNQMRRLLVAKDFTDSAHGRAWHPGCTYPQFQAQVMPAVKAFDEALQERTAAWDQSLTASASGDPKGRGGKKKAAFLSDLILAGKGRSPYPIYKTLQKAEHFTMAELLTILKQLGEADRRLKRSGSAGRIILEHVILTICEPSGERSAPRSA